MDPIAVFAVLLALGLGFAAGHFRGALSLATLRATLAAERRAAAERSGDALAATPLRDCLDRVEVRLRELEIARVGAYSALTEQVGMVRVASEQLTTQTAALATALRAPQNRGRWGELQLRRVVELAGMVEHCDFVEQDANADGTLRPDMVVRLTGGRTVVVDAKVSLAAYLEAAATTLEEQRESRLRAHSRHVRAHVDGLAAKQYWTAQADTPEFVVLFIPGDPFLGAALEKDPELLEHALAKRVLIATPTTLVAMLRTIAWGWQQDSLTAHAREVFDLGRELYSRLGTYAEHVDRLGRTLGRAVNDFNAAGGCLESRVLVSARRLHATGVAAGEIPTPRVVEVVPRPSAVVDLEGRTQASP
ncbi:MAG: DNA recombination protein RmuC [Sporichthyaceae bacterium]